MKDYSQTYAATLTILAGILGNYLNKYGFSNSDIGMTLSTVVTLGGIVWQLYHRYLKGDITPMGMRK